MSILEIRGKNSITLMSMGAFIPLQKNYNEQVSQTVPQTPCL